MFMRWYGRMKILLEVNQATKQTDTSKEGLVEEAEEIVIRW